MEEDDEDYGDRELLERARRLCLAATQLNLPVIKMPQNEGEGFKKDIVEPAKKPRRPQSSGKTIAARPGSGKVTIEKLPELQLSEEQRKLREAERVRQAQERARGRVARSNQHEQLEAEREHNALEQKARLAVERIAAQEKLVEESRWRAEERIRAKRQMMQLTLQGKNAEKFPDPEKRSVDEKKMKMFRRTTYERLLAIASENNKHQIREEEQEQPHQSEEDENRDILLKQRQKKLRQETAERLRRMQLLHEEQQRQEQESVEKGLQQFKSRQRDLDRVAKGFAPAKRENFSYGRDTKTDTHHCAPDKSADLQQNILEANEMDIVHDVEEHFEEVSKSSEVNDIQKDIQIENQDQDIYHTEEFSQHQSNPCPIEQPGFPTFLIDYDHDSHTQPQSSGLKNQRRKVPSWKLPPVPILPKEFYSMKALVSKKSHQRTLSPITSDSYTDKFILRRTNAL